MGATSFTTRDGFKYEADLKIYSAGELNDLRPGLLGQGDPRRQKYYLYGWIELKEWPQNTWTITPRCDLQAWNDYFKVDLILSVEDKSEILIPLGSTVNNKKFNLKIR